MNMHKIKTGAYMALIFIPVILIVLWEERAQLHRWVTRYTSMALVMFYILFALFLVVLGVYEYGTVKQ